MGAMLGDGSEGSSEGPLLGDCDGAAVSEGELVHAATRSTKAKAPDATKRAVIDEMGTTTARRPFSGGIESRGFGASWCAVQNDGRPRNKGSPGSAVRGD